MSLLEGAERFASIDRSQVVLLPQRCLHSQGAASDCAACLDLCPAGAIRQNAQNSVPALDSAACQDCLACLPACPVGAFSADDDVSPLLNCLTHLEGKTLELLCSRHPAPESGPQAESVAIRVRGCLAGLGSGALLLLLAVGVERLILRTEACPGCEWASLAGRVHAQARGAGELAAAWGRPAEMLCTDGAEVFSARPLWEVHNPPLSRRDLFRLLARQGQVALARAAEKGAMASKRQPGRDRLRILSAAAHLTPPPAGQETVLEGFGFAALHVSEACSACGACARLCPTQALSFEKNADESEFKLSFSPRSCIDCGLCPQACAPAALTLEPDPSFAYVFGAREALNLAAGPLARCEKCKSLIAARPGVTLCDLCEFRREHPFGSVLPAELKARLAKPREVPPA